MFWFDLFLAPNRTLLYERSAAIELTYRVCLVIGILFGLKFDF